MKIGFATSEFVTEKLKGGQAAYLGNIARIFAKNGHEIRIIVPSEQNGEFVWEEGIIVHRVKYKEEIYSKKIKKYNIIKRFCQLLWSYAGISVVVNRKVRELYKENEVEIVQYSSLRGIPLFMSKKIPSVVRISAHPTYWRCAMKESFDIKNIGKEYTVLEKIWLRSFRKANCIFGPSRMIGQIIGERINREIKTIESPVQVDRKCAPSKVYDNYLKGKPYLLFWGTLNYLKGIQVIAPILDAFLDKYKEMYFVFVGKDTNVIHAGCEMKATEYILSYVKKHNDRVVLLEPVYEKEELNTIIYNSDGCVLPSRIDNLPNTCIEAMALGKIVIGTNGASFEQLIDDGISGFLCERDDPDNLLSIMIKLMNMTEEEKLVMGERAKERTRQMSDDKIYRQLISIYQEVIQM